MMLLRVLKCKVKLFIFYFCTLSFLLSGCADKNAKPANDDPEQQSPYTFSLPLPGKVSEKEKQKLQSQIESWYQQYLQKSALNGAVFVAKNGVVLFEKYQGTEPIHSNNPVNASTAFHIASVSKTFTAMLVLKLQEKGKLNIDDLYSAYFPEFNYPGVTIKTLLNHRSGLPNYLYFMERLWEDPKQFISNGDILHYLITKKDQLTNIGTPDRNFSYCNTNYALLALLIEKVTGKSYPEYVKQEIFDPLQMTHSFVYTEADSARVSLNYDWRGQVIPMNYLDHVYGDKNIYSTAQDLFRWDRLLSSGNYLSDSSLSMAYTAYSNERPGIKNYGLGWRMDEFPNGKKMIFHNGWWHGNTASFVRLLDEDVCIITYSNRFTRSVYKTKQLINIFADYFPYSHRSDDAESEE